MWILLALRNIGGSTGGTFASIFSTLGLFTWDTILTLINPILPRKRQIALTWNEYVPPTPTDSRSPCPALNALCNHGILPHDGKDISFKQIADVVHTHYNFSSTFCKFVCQYIASALKKDYNDKIELSAIGTHNCIEHDGSLVRADVFFQPDQGVPAPEIIRDFFSTTKDGKNVTPADCARAITNRLTHSGRNNPHFSLRGIHSFFAASNAATLIVIMGGKIEVLEPFLLEERIPEGWTSANKTRLGLTMGRFNLTVLRILLGIDPSWKSARGNGKSSA
ncbi:hypothetical protein Clacol_007133 [Clathrus columnatus]|uniref:Heme haloperoxidase family profile domain-containing protein n=1 Tax=Clathrus columnatus TaxID=1419009 RepID=A0AAV5AE26_9AGAM|nr:hypothetical protein Clacol_007133 [Clathrus columnatus]